MKKFSNLLTIILLVICGVLVIRSKFALLLIAVFIAVGPVRLYRMINKMVRRWLDVPLEDDMESEN